MLHCLEILSLVSKTIIKQFVLVPTYEYCKYCSNEKAQHFLWSKNKSWARGKALTLSGLNSIYHASTAKFT